MNIVAKSMEKVTFPVDIPSCINAGAFPHELVSIIG